MPAELVALYRALAARGMNTASTGNVSRRTAAGMLITPTGCTAETLGEAGLVETPLDGPLPGTAPSSEWSMHAAIYQAHPEAGAIVHTHADACTALACLAEPLPAFHYMVLSFGADEIPCAPYATFGTPELARSALAALERSTACLLANHGMICHAATPAGALRQAILLETLCRQYLLARSAGTPRLLTAAEREAARARLASYAAAAVGLSGVV